MFIPNPNLSILDPGFKKIPDPASVADPGCLFRIPEPNSSIPDPGSKRSRIRIKEFKYFYSQKIVPELSDLDLGSSGQKSTGSAILPFALLYPRDR
jgi:hypothetical protein